MHAGLILILLIFCIMKGNAQEVFSFTFRETPVEEVLGKIEQQTGYIFSYSPSILHQCSLKTISIKQANLEQVLNLLFKSSNISWEKLGRYIILKQGKRFFIVYGRIYDRGSRERLIGASVYDSRLHVGAATNNYGFYTLIVPEGEVCLNYSYVGYQRASFQFYLKSDTVIHIELKPMLNLDEIVVVQPNIPGWVKNSQPGQVEFPIFTATVIPKLLGESDLLKAVQLFPGVRVGMEGIAGILVRGGNRDENQFLIDDIPLYNANHLLGFFSVFNSDAVKNVNFYKSSFPARYGGHLSSIMDIRLKEGNLQEYHGSFSIGLLSSKFNIEGPIERNRSSFNITARRTYLDLLGAPIYAAINNTKDSKEKIGYNFTDINIKLTRIFSQQNALSLILFYGNDYLKYKKDEKESYYIEPDRTRDYMRGTWGNWGVGLRWDKMISTGLYANTVLSYNQYRAFMNKKSRNENASGDTIRLKKIRFKSGQEEWRLKSDLTWAMKHWSRLYFGGHYIYHVFTPEKRTTLNRIEEEMPSRKLVNYKEYAHELALYLEDKITIQEKWIVHPGIRAILFYVGSTNYFSLEPRFSIQYNWTDHWETKASYTLMSQYIHQLGSSTMNMPTDLWVPVSDNVKPMKSHQCVLGIYYHPCTQWHFSLEGFYKTHNHLLNDYNGVDVTLEYSDWKENVHSGKGHSYGLEWMGQKTGGRTNGWINYTLSRAYRWFPDGSINQGRRFPAKYDSRHMLNLVLLHKFSNFFDISATWTFNNGFYTTQPLERYNTPTHLPGEKGEEKKDIIFHIEKRNNMKPPDYHRLDLGFNFHRRRKHGISTWSINLYNAYCRQNTIELSPDYDSKYGNREERQYFSNDWLFPIIPSFSYTFTF